MSHFGDMMNNLVDSEGTAATEPERSHDALQIEDVVRNMQAIREGATVVTPTNCPYFHINVVDTDPIDGVKVASVSLLEISTRFALDFGDREDPVPLERPDIALIHTSDPDTRQSMQMAPTHFYVTENGALCCVFQRENTTQVNILTSDNYESIDGISISRKEPIPGQEIWVFVEDEAPPTSEELINPMLYFPYAEIRDAVRARNYAWGVKPPAALHAVIQGKWQNSSVSRQPPIEKQNRFIIQTSQEFDAISSASCDGKLFRHYTRNAQAVAITHEREGFTHRVRVGLTDDEISAGLGIDYLEKLVRAQDADAVFSQLYIMSVLSPSAPLPPRAFAGGWIDFDDVIDKIGWYPQNTRERHAMHGKILSVGREALIKQKRAQVGGLDKVGTVRLAEVRGFDDSR